MPRATRSATPSSASGGAWSAPKSPDTNTHVSSDSERTRVFVADDHPLYREGVVRAIRERPDLELVGEASDGRDTLEQLKELLPDVAVLDVKMPGLDGTDVLNAISRDGLSTRVVFLSAYLDSAVVYRAVAAGAVAEAMRRGLLE